MARREASCPLCGAKLTPAQVLDACEEIADEKLGVLACHCPYCQGHLEVMPAAGRLDIGYLRNGRFDVVLTLAGEGLTVLRDTASGTLRVRMAGRDWKFRE
jgi:hypothetical protein